MTATIPIRGRNVPVDIRAELERFDWIRARWTADKLLAASPFRYDSHPSFFVNLSPDSEYYGTWSDSGAADPEFSSGGLPKLLAFLMGITYDEATDYLLATYGSDDAGETVTLDIPKLNAGKAPYKPLSTSILEDYRYRHVYLGTRMITEGAQRAYGIGYDRKRNAVTFPWYNANGTLGNIQYRRTDSKIFWFERGGRPIREMLYGINVVYRTRAKRAAITEGAPDALTFTSAGVAGIATGGAQFSREKADLILRSPIEELIVATDNDAAGRKLADDIVRSLAGKVALSFAVIPDEYKDINELAVKGGGLDAVKACADGAKALRLPFGLR